MPLAVGTPVTRRPCTDPDVQFTRIRFFACTRFRVEQSHYATKVSEPGRVRTAHLLGG